MATAQDIIDSATLKLGIRQQGTAFNTYDSSANTDAFVVLQDLISELVADNALHIPTPAATTDTLDLYPEQIRSLKLLLARDLKMEFRVGEAPQELLAEIKEAERNLRIDNNISISADLSGLVGVGRARYNINTD